MRQINIQLSNKVFYTLIALMFVVLLGAGVLMVNAYVNPATGVGHTADDIEGVCRTDGTGCNELDPTVITSVKDGVSWAEVTGKPAGFADNVDNVGGGTIQLINCEIISAQYAAKCPAGKVLVEMDRASCGSPSSVVPGQGVCYAKCCGLSIS